MRGDSLKGRPGMSEGIINFEINFRLPFRRLTSRGGERGKRIGATHIRFS